MLRLTLFPVMALLLVGCVKKGIYEEQLSVNADLRVQNDKLMSEIDEMSARIDVLEADLTAADEALAGANATLTDTRARLADTQDKLTTKMAEAGALQDDIDEMKRALRELEERKAQAEASLRTFRGLVSRFQAMIDAGTLQVKVVDGRMVVELATDILFPTGSATLSADGQKTVAEVARVLATIPERDFQVAGHTDNVPIGTERFPSNWDLGAARAITVTQLLVESGLPSQRVSAASYADTRPVDTNETKQGRAHNRRIEIIVVPDLSELPGYEELQGLSSGQ